MYDAYRIIRHLFVHCKLLLFSLQCFDIVGWATGRAYPACKQTGCWFVGGDDLTGALHDL